MLINFPVPVFIQNLVHGSGGGHLYFRLDISGVARGGAGGAMAPPLIWSVG